MFYPAELDNAKLEAIQALESELGKTIVAVAPQGEPACMTPAELDKLKQAEDRLGVVLVAHKR